MLLHLLLPVGFTLSPLVGWLMGAERTRDCANRISDAILFKLPRHSSHHLAPPLDCNGRYRKPGSPQMPTGYAGMTILAMLWPLYQRVMTPRLPDTILPSPTMTGAFR